MSFGLCILDTQTKFGIIMLTKNCFDMKKFLYLLVIQIIFGCNNNDKIKDRIQLSLCFERADTLREFNGNGSFAVKGDTFFISDYGYNHHDKKEVSVFRLNKPLTTRILSRMGNGGVEINVDGHNLQVFRRCFNGIYEEYDTNNLMSDSIIYKYQNIFAHTDHIVKAGKYFVGADIIGSPNILNLYDNNGKLLQSLDPFDGVLKDITEIGKKYTVGQGFLTYNSIDQFVVYATVYTGEIFIYDVKDNKLHLLHKINIGHGLPTNYKNFERTEDTRIYTNDICQCKHYVYILVKDATIKEKKQRCYILRINKQGDMYCMESPQPLLRIYVDRHKLYSLAQKDSEKNILMSADLN